MGTQRGQMKEVLSWLVRWACRAGMGSRYFCSALAALSAHYKIFLSSPDTISIPVSPSPSKLGRHRQPCWVACLLVCVSGKERSKLKRWGLEQLRLQQNNVGLFQKTLYGSKHLRVFYYERGQFRNSACF